MQLVQNGEVIIMQNPWNKLNCVARKCNYLLHLAHFSFVLRKTCLRASIWNYALWCCLFFAVCCTLQTANRCLLDLVGVDPKPAGCVDGWPTTGLFLSSLFFSFKPATRAADPGGERRGETKKRIVIWEPKTDWVSKSLAPACCRRQPAKRRFLCTFTTVNGKFNQSFIEMVISSADRRVCARTHADPHII